MPMRSGANYIEWYPRIRWCVPRWAATPRNTRSSSNRSGSSRMPRSRQRSMRAVFTWSWQLLNAQEQTIFRQLAIFQGSFTRSAAEQIAGATLPLLARLMNKSLIHVADPTLAEGRYQAGVGNIIELGDAQVAQTSAAAQAVQAEYNLATARAQLGRALGRG